MWLNVFICEQESSIMVQHFSCFPKWSDSIRSFADIVTSILTPIYYSFHKAGGVSWYIPQPHQSFFSSQLLFWYLPCHLQSWKTVNCLPYQQSKEWLYPPYYFFIIVHRNFVLVLWCAGPHDVCYLEMVRFPGRRFHSLLYIFFITKIHICLWSYKSYSDEIVILILHKYCYY